MTEITTKANKRGDITIRIPGAVLRTAFQYNENFAEGSRVTHTKTFADEVVTTFMTEDEVGGTLLTAMVDQAMSDAVEWGAAGVKLGDEE